jgi:glycine cleavage system aminomethyltransferase T
MDHVGLLRLVGDDALEAVDTICSGDLWVRDGRMRQTLILDDRAQPVADVYVCPDNDACFLMVEGITTEELSDCLARYVDADLDFELEDLRSQHELISVHGPYAWEVMSRWLTPDIIGLPYLSFYHFDRGVCFRAGKTGEFGYDLMLRNEDASNARKELLELVTSLDGAEVSLETLDLCALENGFFSVRHGSVEGLTPIELQLQWRVSTRKRFPGVTAIEERRARGIRRRLTHFVAADGVKCGDVLQGPGSPVGEVMTAAFSPGVGGLVGTALLDISVAHPGIAEFFVRDRDSTFPIRTVSSPLVLNRSLLVDPRSETYLTRQDALRPPLWQGSLP